MAGFSIILVLFLFFAAIIGVLAFLAGVIFLIISAVLKKRHNNAGNPLLIIGTIGLITGFILCLPMTALLGWFGFSQTQPPEDFVETEIVIEENGYQDTRFTADGVLYEVLDFEAEFFECNHVAEPVFSYKTEGLFNGKDCGNYYRIENEQGFDLIWDNSSRLFCPAEEKERVMTYYLREDLNDWRYCTPESSDYPAVWVDAEYEALFVEFYLQDLDALEKTVTRDIGDEAERVEFFAYSSDNLLTKYNCVFHIIDGEAYFEYEVEYFEDGAEDTAEWTLIRLPEELEAPLVKVSG